ncbi:MAG TPA: DUF3105 domain-containing protein [Actinomycetota bacterium]|nr:DUF3105 domain-containing protein [Actinomycetota bacterium]
MQGGAAYLVASRTISGVTDQRIMTVKRDADGGWRYAGNSACYGEESPQDLGNRHLDEGEPAPTYSSNPPTSGPHDSTPSQTGTIFKTPQPSEQLVHSMEHGAVIFWTNLQEPLAKTAEDAVLDVYDQGYESLIITPKSDMDVPLAITAWGSLQKCVGVDATEIQRFVDAHYAQGLEGFMACFNDKATSLPGCEKAL